MIFNFILGDKKQFYANGLAKLFAPYWKMHTFANVHLSKCKNAFEIGKHKSLALIAFLKSDFEIWDSYLKR